MRVSRIPPTIALISRLVLADVEFISPAAGTSVAQGTIEVQWQESGVSPSIDDLTGYTLSLMTGGNDDTNNDMLPLTQFVSGGKFTVGNETQGTIPAGIAEGFTNGFFFRMVSTAEAGGTVTNYSPRFSITGLTGSTPLEYKHAVEALDGSTAGPDTVNDVAGSGSSSTSSSRTTTLSSVASTSTVADSSQTSTLTKMHTSTMTPTSTASQTHNAAPHKEQATATTTSTAHLMPGGSLHEDQGGLSTEAVVGIAVAGAIFGVTLFCLIAWVMIRKRRSRQAVAVNGGKAYIDDKAELCAEPPKLQSTSTLSELSSDGGKLTELSSTSEVVEAPDRMRLPELDPNNVRAELP